MVVVVGESWDPELRLTLGRSADLTPAESVSSSRSSVMDESFGNSTHFPQQQQQQRKKITMFYNGQICACDVAEMQANAILSMAMRGIDDMTSKNHQYQDKYQQQQQQRMAQSSPPLCSAAPSPSPRALQQLHQPGLSMKRSLQRFLQKRKSRIAAASPYAHRKQQLLLFPIES